MQIKLVILYWSKVSIETGRMLLSRLICKVTKNMLGANFYGPSVKISSSCHIIHIGHTNKFSFFSQKFSLWLQFSQFGKTKSFVVLDPR